MTCIVCHRRSSSHISKGTCRYNSSYLIHSHAKINNLQQFNVNDSRCIYKVCASVHFLLISTNYSLQFSWMDMEEKFEKYNFVSRDSLAAIQCLNHVESKDMPHSMELLVELTKEKWNNNRNYTTEVRPMKITTEKTRSFLYRVSKPTINTS